MFKEFKITGLEDTFYDENFGTIIGKISKGIILNNGEFLYLKICDDTDIFDLGEVEDLNETIRASKLCDDLKQEINMFLEVEYA